MPTYKVDLVTVAAAVATVYVEAVSKEDAREIAISSCCEDDFEIVQLGIIETTDISKHE